MSESLLASVEVAPEKLTSSGEVPICGNATAFATGWVFANVVKLDAVAGGFGDVAVLSEASAELAR